MELLRREALADVAAAAGGPALAPAAAAAPDVIPAPMAPPRADPALGCVTAQMVSDVQGPLPVQPAHPLADLVVAYAGAAQRDGIGSSGNKAAEHAVEYWDPHANVWHSTSREAQASAADTGRHSLRRSEQRMAAAAELAERHTQEQVQTSLALSSPEVELLAFVEGARYDESTSVLSVGQPLDDFLQVAGVAPGDLSQALLKLVVENNPTEAVPTKVFQTEGQRFALLAVATCDPAQPKTYTLLSSDVVTCPQILQQNTAEAVAQALVSSTTCRPRTLAKFKWKMRMVCSDRGSSNLAAERLVQLSRPDWHQLFFPCEVHMSTSCQSKGLLLMDDVVAKLIRTGLSLRLGGWMRIFRRCMLQEIIATLEVLEGEPSAAAAQQRQRAMCMFMEAGARRKHRAILACLPKW